MEESRWLQALVGGPVLLKCENLQRTGSFKIRGAYVRMSRLADEERARGVVAASAGNHAQGVALAAQMLGIKATVFMPEGAPIPKVNATRGYGAEVRFHGRVPHQALRRRARSSPSETGAVLIHPFDHPDIVAGQGTVRPGDPRAGARGRDRAGARPAAAGCSPAIALAVKAHAPRRPGGRGAGRGGGGVPGVARSRGAGRAGADDHDGRRHRGGAARATCRSRRSRSTSTRCVTVSEESMSRALVMLLERAKMVVEPAGAAAVAAMLDQPERLRDARSWRCSPAATSTRCCWAS